MFTAPREPLIGNSRVDLNFHIAPRCSGASQFGDQLRLDQSGQARARALLRSCQKGRRRIVDRGNVTLGSPEGSGTALGLSRVQSARTVSNVASSGLLIASRFCAVGGRQTMPG